MKKAIIIGASSGIGRALAIEMSKAGYVLGLTARRTDLLTQLQAALPNESFVQTMDLAQVEESVASLAALVEKMQGVEVIILNSALGLMGIDWKEVEAMIQVNIMGTTALAHWALNYFKQKGGGHIVGISSVAKHRAHRNSIVYSATKSFLSAYLQGLRHYSEYYKKNITISDIRPGFVETPMTAQNDPKKMFWLATSEEAAYYILRAIEKRKAIAYITPRWWWAAKVMQYLPDFIMHRL